MLQKGSVTDFTGSELLRENQQGGGGSGKINPLTQIRAKGVTDTMTAEKGVTDTHRHLQLGILDTRNSKWYNKEWLRI